MAKKRQFDLKKFRHAVAELKRAGLIKNVDARSAQPFFVRGGKTLKETVSKYDDVVSGKLQPVKLPPKKIKDLGYEKATVGKESFALIPKSAGEKVKVEKDTIKIIEPKGIERIKKAVPFHRLDEYLRKLKSHTKTINKMKADNEWFAFKVFGRRSWSVYRSIDDLVDDLRAYRSWRDVMSEKLSKQKELYEGLEILRVPDSDKWHSDKEAEAEAVKRKKQKYNKAARKRWLKRIKGTAIDERRKKSHREAQADYRERQKSKRKKTGKKQPKKSRR